MGIFFQEDGNIVRKYLPPDNEINRRNKKYRDLFEAFDTIDGKPPQTFNYGVS
jgi:centrosomal protein CEP104